VKRYKFINVLFFIVILFSLAACSSSPTGGETPQENQAEADAGSHFLLPFVMNQSGTPSGDTDAYDCATNEEHRIGQSIAETFDVPYVQVMTWFCSGFSFDNILVALETSEAVDIPAEALLQMVMDQTWEEVWDQIGFVENQ
jgi:hypothetical protein